MSYSVQEKRQSRSWDLNSRITRSQQFRRGIEPDDSKATYHYDIHLGFEGERFARPEQLIELGCATSLLLKERLAVDRLVPGTGNALSDARVRVPSRKMMTLEQRSEGGQVD